MQKITSSLAPAAVGPYCQAYEVNGLIFTSGQLPITADGKMPTTLIEQAHVACKNVKAVLEAGNSSLQQVVKTTCYLANINDFAAFNEVYANYFTNHPARSCFAVKDLPKGALCEIEAIAEREKK